MPKVQQLNKRIEGNYDLLRIICAIAVIIIHVSATYKNTYTDSEEPYQVHITTTLLYNTLARFAVPCFMMISGAFLLDNTENQNYKYFYKKSLIKIGIPTIIFSFLYFFYSLSIELVTFIKHGEYSVFLKPLKDLIKGAPFYHMWYLYTLIGVYFLIPVLIRIKSDLGEKKFAYVSWIYLIVATISGFTSTSLLNWSISKVVLYLGFVMAGYQIRNKAKEKKNKLKGIIFIVISLLLLLLLTYIQYGRTISGFAESDEKYTITGNFNPIVVLSSILLFSGFSNLSINSNYLHILSNNTFIIYLFHAGVWHLISNLFFKIIGSKTDPVFTIPVGVLVTFVISWLLTIIYNKLWAAIDRKLSISSRICKLVRLNY